MLQTIRTPYELKYNPEFMRKHPHFFDRETMKFFGDTMKNFGLTQLKKGKILCLYRRRPVKHGINGAFYFDSRDFSMVRNLDEVSDD